jgi:hypothetical protein
MLKVKWMTLIVGLIIGIIFGSILGILTSWGDIFGYLIAALYVGYVVDGNYKNGAIYGMLIGAVAALIVLILSLIGLGVPYATNVVAAGLMAIITVLIFALVIGAVSGALGGIIGVFIKLRIK